MCGPVNADDYPSRPVKIIVPFGAGGPTDVYTRASGEELRKALHQPFVMDNRPGAGTTIGTDFVAKSPPDGYTLLMVSGTQTVNETLYAHKQYQLMRDLVPVAPLIDTDLVLVVHPSVQAKTLGELLALARSNPGAINYGSSGPGSNYHMAAELVKNITGIDMVHVPYKGSTGARNDIIAGQIDVMFDSVPTMAPVIEAGLVRPLVDQAIEHVATSAHGPVSLQIGSDSFDITVTLVYAGDLPNLPNFRKANPNASPIFILALTSNTRPPSAIYDIADTVIAQRLSQIDGVAEANVSGAEQPGR